MVDAGGMHTVLFYLDNIFMCIYLLVISIMIWFLPFDLWACRAQNAHKLHTLHLKIVEAIFYQIKLEARLFIYLHFFKKNKLFFSKRKYFALWVYIRKMFSFDVPSREYLFCKFIECITLWKSNRALNIFYFYAHPYFFTILIKNMASRKEQVI